MPQWLLIMVLRAHWPTCDECMAQTRMLNAFAYAERRGPHGVAFCRDAKEAISLRQREY